MKCLTLAAVTALLVMSCTSGFASATASATLSDLKVTLTDLTPDDGIDPSVTFGTQDNAYSAVALPGGGQLTQLASGSVAFGEVSTAESALSESAYSNIVGDAYGAGATISVGSNASRPDGPSSSAFIDISGFETLTLAPGSEVRISGTLDLFASTAYDDASAQALCTIALFPGDDISQLYTAFLWTSPDNNDPDQTLEEVQDESVFLANTTSAPITALFDISLNTATVASTISEPSSAALVLAGLAALIAWKRRRA